MDAAQKRSRRNLELKLVIVSAAVFSTAGLFSKAIHSGPWDIIFWRGLFARAFTAIYVFIKGTIRQEFVQMGTSGVAAAIVGASGTAAFIPAFRLVGMSEALSRFFHFATVIDPVAPGQHSQTLLNIVYCSTDRLCRRGAAV